MKVLGVYERIPKTKWQEIANVAKSGGVVDIHTIKNVNSVNEVSILLAIIAFKESEIEDRNNLTVFGINRRLEGTNRLKNVYILEDPVIINQEVFNDIGRNIRSQAIVKVSEVLGQEFGRYLQIVLERYQIQTRDGLLGVIGRLAEKVGSKISRDTFKARYGSYILGEMWVENKTLQETHSTGKWFEHSSTIGVDVQGSTVYLYIAHGDDTERGYGVGDTYHLQTLNLDKLPLEDFKKGSYHGEEFAKLLDFVFRVLILSSSEGYNEYVSEYGTPKYGDTPKYAWLTLKDGTKVTWENYDFNQLAQLLVQ